MLTVAIPKRNKLQNIIVLTPKDGGTAFRASSASNAAGMTADFRQFKKLVKK